jgi:hypothetical protein
MAGKLGMGLLETLLENLDRDLNLANSTLTNPIITTSAAVTTTGTVSMTGTAVNIPSLHGGGIQRHTTDAILTIADTTTLVDFAHATGGNRVITMPAATAGRHLKIIWSIAQATTDRVLTCAGSDDFTGTIFTSVTGDVVGDGDLVSVTDGTVAITFVDDVLIGSEINCYCAVAGAWIISGHLAVDAAGSVPTIA